jgi:hypothetical protein
MAIETTTLHSRALAAEPLADKKTLRRVLVASSLGTLFEWYAGLLFPIAVCVVTIVVSAIWIRETKHHKLDV